MKGLESRDRDHRNAALEYAVHQGEPGQWIAEAIDTASEGEMYWAVFYGLGSEQRARQYARWMNTQLDGSHNIINAS